ncbi:MAG: hypothetical protein LBG69_03850 [Zoogloeaceae bacterium]|jgi:hypothetical protein|nr:hypothetical protein [Zoogloeaceae bacterium]
METLRAQYQKALLAWLKTADAGGAPAFAALGALRKTLAALGETRPDWRPLADAGEAFFAAIASGRLPNLLEYRRLGGRIEQTLRVTPADARFQETITQIEAILPSESSANPSAQEPASLAAEMPAPEKTGVAQPDAETPPAAPPDLRAADTPRKKDPVSETLDRNADILPLLGRQPKEPRFTLRQRALWDSAAEAFALAWDAARRPGPPAPLNAEEANAAEEDSAEAEAARWRPLRRAIFRLLEGALPLEHPAPLQLAEALASATDSLDSGAPPAPRLLTALAACAELLEEKDLLEHAALESLSAQFAHRLAKSEETLRSQAIDALFAEEAREELEQIRQALEMLPPNTGMMSTAAERLQRLADPLELSELALAAFHFAHTASRLPPALLDRSPVRETAFSWLKAAEEWIAEIERGENPPPPEALEAAQADLRQALRSPIEPGKA